MTDKGREGRGTTRKWTECINSNVFMSFLRNMVLYLPKRVQKRIQTSQKHALSLQGNTFYHKFAKNNGLKIESENTKIFQFNEFLGCFLKLHF